MSIALDPRLAAAQDNPTRRPLVEIMSVESLASIPFGGQYLDSTSNLEAHPAVIILSSGRIALSCYYYTGARNGYHIRYQYTDTARTAFTTVDIVLGEYEEVSDVSLCELVNGDVGIVYMSTDAGYRRIKYKIVSPIGTVVSAGGTIRTMASKTTFASGPYVLRLANGSHLLVYSEIVPTDSPSHYHLFKYTSTDFEAWSGPTELNIAGLTDANKKFNPSLVQITTGQIWLWLAHVDSIGPNGEELKNIYYSTSDDNGVTWGNAVKFTAYNSYSVTGTHPVAVQKTSDTLHLMLDEYRPALHMDKLTPNWVPDYSAPCSMHFDAASRKLYATIRRSHTPMSGVVQIDVDTWTVVKHWDRDSIPSIPVIYLDGPHGVVSTAGSGKYVVLGTYYYDRSHPGEMVSVLDAGNNTITNYVFRSEPAYGLAQNVTYTPISSNQRLRGTQIDEANGRIWVAFEELYGKKLQIGYLPLGDMSGSYTFTNVVMDTNAWNAGAWVELAGFSFSAHPAADMIIANKDSTGQYPGQLNIYNMTTGALWKSFCFATHSDFPYHGLHGAEYHNGKIYGGITHYTGSLGVQTSMRGVAILDIATERTTWSRPTWESVDNYSLYSFGVIKPDNILMCAQCPGGVALYDIRSGAWTRYNNDTVPGFVPNNSSYFTKVVYDEASGSIYAAEGDDYQSYWSGIVGFSRYGQLKRSTYYTGLHTTGWSWTDHREIVAGYNDHDLVAVPDPVDKSLYAFWVRDDATEQSLKWDKENAEFDLSDYLLRGEEIRLHRSIDGSPASLSFSVSHGHLFDSSNSSSLLHPLLTKGRKLTLRFGEKISGIDVWQKQGTFFVTEQSVAYRRGDYPTMKITAEDRTTMWPDIQIIASELYTAMPEAILVALLVANTDLSNTDIDTGTWVNGVPLTHQWIDTTLAGALQDILDRFGYYVRIDVNDKVTCRRISDVNAVDHTYSDNTRLMEYAPDDRFSDFTNRIVVIGTEQTEIEMLFPEEQVATLNGTFGWYTGRESHRVWYSLDRARRCKYPRLEVIRTAASVAFELGGNAREYLLDNSVSEASSDLRYKYCTVVVDAPNLTSYFVSSLALLVGSFFIPDGVVSFLTGLGFTKRIGSYLSVFFIWTTLTILAAVGNYEYAIWARPCGTVRRTLQATWNDTDMQALTGHVITKKIEDPLCYSEHDCQVVANFEGLVTQLQRRRISFKKVAHLQDEDGDTLSVVHPITGRSLSLFITDLDRVMKIPVGNDDGYFMDEIQAWRL